MASNMIAAQHNCKGLLNFILLDNTVTVKLEVMTLTGVYIYRKDRNCLRKVLFLGVSRKHLLQHF